ncbi:MAG: hypothetical protein ACR5K7_00830 [Symbiopectobacterium sp.]
MLLMPRGGTFGDPREMLFAQAWQSQSGNTLLQQRFGNMAELKQAIKR